MAHKKQERDYLDDQMGWSVRELLFPTREIRRLDYSMMQILPRRARNLLTYWRTSVGLMPTYSDPAHIFDSSSRNLGEIYLDHMYSSVGVNTIYMPGISHPQEAHASDFTLGQRVVSVRWEAKINWAHRVQRRLSEDCEVAKDEIEEAKSLFTIRDILSVILNKTEKDFDTRGLPRPDMVKIRQSLDPNLSSACEPRRS